MAAFATLVFLLSVSFGVVGFLKDRDWKSALMGLQGVVFSVSLYLVWVKG